MSAAALERSSSNSTQDDDLCESGGAILECASILAGVPSDRSSLLAAFEGWPRITPPCEGKRIFQLRTYESPSYRDHILKVQMFHSGEFEIFKNAGFQMVFFGDTLIGQRMPSLTYMLSFADSAEMDAKWALFATIPRGRSFQPIPRFAFEGIVSNITNLVLSPLAASQI